MIPCSHPPLESAEWQKELASAFGNAGELLRHLGLEHRLQPDILEAAKQFPLRVTRHFASLMRQGDPDDPLLRQVLPLAAELSEAPGFVIDPVGDNLADCGDGILQKYHGRALVIATGACAIHCRYCFRRHFAYQERSARGQEWEALVDNLAAHPALTEVILSGGDPLTLSDRRLGQLLAALQRLPGLRRLRLHSRLPVVLPSRITEDLVALLEDNPWSVSLVIHANHPNELNRDTARALDPLRRAGITLLNQSVLLRGINDQESVLRDLSEALFDMGVLPYYLHLLDPVKGAAHFAVGRSAGRSLIAALRRQLPGYLVPRLVMEEPGSSEKTPL